MVGGTEHPSRYDNKCRVANVRGSDADFRAARRRNLVARPSLHRSPGAWPSAMSSTASHSWNNHGTGAQRAPQVVDACLACGRTTSHLLRFRTNGCDILQCGECGLGRTEASEFDPAAYYTEDYFAGRHV